MNIITTRLPALKFIGLLGISSYEYIDRSDYKPDLTSVLL